MDWITLTYYNPARTHGSRAGRTGKHFLLRAEDIRRLTPYEDSTKLKLSSGEDIEVGETLKTILQKLKAADHVH